MRFIYNDSENMIFDVNGISYSGNGGYLISPEIDYFLIPKKGRRCRSIYFNDDGAFNLKCALEEDNIKIQPEDIVNQPKFWNNKGLFVAAVFKKPFFVNGPSDTTRHSVIDIYRKNNGHYRLVDDELLDTVTDGRFSSDENKLFYEITGEFGLDNDEIEYAFNCAEFMYYDVNH